MVNGIESSILGRATRLPARICVCVRLSVIIITNDRNPVEDVRVRPLREIIRVGFYDDRGSQSDVGRDIVVERLLI